MSTIQTNAIVDAAGGNTATVNGQNITSSNTMGRNLIRNGAMQVAQRGVSGTTPTTQNYVIDQFPLNRYGGYPDNAAQSQTTDAPEGFHNSFKMIRNSAYTLTGTNASSFTQRLEGLNTSYLNWGTSTAKPVIISFWVKSNQTGNFPFILADSGNALDIGKLYTINSANTWEYKTIAIEAPTSGTFDTDNTTSVQVVWGFGSTSSARTAQGSTWGTSNGAGSSKSMVTGASTALATVNGATWQITGVQMEVGTGATEFEYKTYADELAACQRYYYQIKQYENAGQYTFMIGAVGGSNTHFVVTNPQVMRAAPTVAYSGTVNLIANATSITSPASFAAYSGTKYTRLQWARGAHTAGQAAWADIDDGVFTFSSEL